MIQFPSLQSLSYWLSSAAHFGLIFAVLFFLSCKPIPAGGELDAGNQAENAGLAGTAEPETKTPISLSKDPHSPALRPNAHPFIDTAAKLLLVLAAVFALFWLLRRFRTPSLNLFGQEGVFGVAALIPLTSKTRLALLRFGKKLLLVSASGERIQLLAETADSEEIESILASLRRPAAKGRGEDQ